MTGPADCRDIRHALGVYVLGAIDPAERAVVDAHLSSCPECREELAGLAGLPALLRRVPIGEAQQLTDGTDDAPHDERPSELMLPSLLSRTAHIRRTRRWRGLAAAAAIVLAAGTAGAIGYSAMHQAGPETSSVASGEPAGHFTTASASNPQTHVSATIRYTAEDWGTAVKTLVKGVPAGTRCQLEITNSSGQTSVVGGWQTTYDEGSTWYPGGSSVALDSVHSFQVTSHGKVLVTVPVR
jgi:anti-sigma factor RsiW